MEEKFDAIVVGAGPSGSAAAWVMARAGLNVLLLERGEYPGSKNVMGGVLYAHALRELDHQLADRMPTERKVVRQSLWLMTRNSAVSLGYEGTADDERAASFTVLRARFDRWFAEEARKVGALLITEVVVEDLVAEDGKVVGVVTGRDQGEVRADAVILAEGVNSLLTWKSGLRGNLSPDQLAVAVKEIIALPREIIDERFGLRGDEGATIEMVGEVTRGMVGTAFLYTNRESLSVGVGVLISDLIDARMTPHDLLEGVKSHPLVERLIDGGETREYLAHLIPEAGYRAIPQLYRDGLLVVGDAAMLVNGIHREGSNMALASGRFAGETVIEAKKRGDFSAKALSEYKRKLEDSFVLKDLRKYRNVAGFFRANRQFFGLYPELINQSIKELITVDGVPKKDKQRRIIRNIKEQRPGWQVLRDLVGAWRVMG